MQTGNIRCHLSITCIDLLCEKRQERKEVTLARLGWTWWGELAAARVSTSPGLVNCRQGPPVLPPLLSAGSAAAKERLNKALFICADCIHCTSQPFGCGTTQICPALQRKGQQTYSQQQSAQRCQGQINRRQCYSSVQCCRPNNPTSSLQLFPNFLF